MPQKLPRAGLDMRKFIPALLIFIAAFLSGARYASAADISNCSVLNVPNEFYNLTQNVANSTNMTCMRIEADNVTLDCGGHTVDGVHLTDLGFKRLADGLTPVLRRILKLPAIQRS